MAEHLENIDSVRVHHPRKLVKLSTSDTTPFSGAVHVPLRSSSLPVDGLNTSLSIASPESPAAPVDHYTIIQQAYTDLTCGTNPLSRFYKSYHRAVTGFAGAAPKTCVCMDPCTFECFITAWIDDIADFEFDLLTTRLAQICTQRFETTYRRSPRKMQWAPHGMGKYMAVPKYVFEAYFGFMNHLETLDDQTLAILCTEHGKQWQSRNNIKGKRVLRKRDEGIGANVPFREMFRQNRDGKCVWSGATFGRWGTLLMY